jgi:hypothetical protein
MTLTTRSVESWPGLTEAVHWLVDDTGWDFHPPHDGDVGTILASRDEVDAVTATLEPLLAILDELGPFAADSDYLNHPRWNQVAQVATNAHQLMVGTSR